MDKSLINFFNKVPASSNLDNELPAPDGPTTIKLSNGTSFYLIDGKLHREDGPALENINGTKEWYINNKLHREDGPAIEYPDGSNEWWYHDEKIDCSSTEEFIRKINLKIFW